jgi:hypothetical protein
MDKNIYTHRRGMEFEKSSTSFSHDCISGDYAVIDKKYLHTSPRYGV